MKRIAGIVFGIVYAVLVALAVGRSLSGWEQGYSDLGFWWAVISVFLTLAGGAALVGSFLHARIDRR